jgi:Mycothiol maleylpyruvate isomerase N-terminal domain
MGAKGEAFAKEFEAKVEDALALLNRLSDADWKKTTAGEHWTVGVTAHHIARSYEPITHIIRTIAAGQAMPHFTPQMLDEMNAQHAKDFAGCTKPETIALLKKGAADAAAALRGLSDADLAKSGTVFTGMPPMSAEDMVKRAILGHIDEHFGSIRKTVGG